jgi:hypothetical protein
MKPIHILTRTLLLATTVTACVTSTFARPSRHAEASVSDRPIASELIPLHDIRHIKLGMTREQVLSSMRGKPDDTMTSETWIYWNFQGNRRPSGMERPAMLVFFTHERVSLIRYSEEHLVRKTLAQLRQAPTATAVAAK